MYKHYYMKQYNCVFCAFPLLSVCLTSFAPILTTNENWILFLAFLKIMWTIFGCKWHFPSRDTTYDIEHDKKECQERRNWSRRIKVSQEDGQNWSCGSISVFVCIFWTNDLICIIVKTWENISSLFSLLNTCNGAPPYGETVKSTQHLGHPHSNNVVEKMTNHIQSYGGQLMKYLPHFSFSLF